MLDARPHDNCHWLKELDLRRATSTARPTTNAFVMHPAHIVPIPKGKRLAFS